MNKITLLLFVLCGLLSQAQILDELEQAPIVLLDDLTSEFDREHFNNVLQRAMQMTGQVWISGTDAPRMEHNHKLFHVEHGTLERTYPGD